MSEFAPIPSATNQIAKKIFECALKVHTALGPGLLESVYGDCLAHEMSKAGLTFQREAPVPLVYDEIRFEAGFRLDFIVENRVIIEIKAIDVMHPVFEAQLLTYLKLSGHRVGLLINFNVPLLKQGVKRLVR